MLVLDSSDRQENVWLPKMCASKQPYKSIFPKNIFTIGTMLSQPDIYSKAAM